MEGTTRNNIRPGLLVDIVLKADQPTGKLTRGTVADILTSKGVHPRGIKVRLTDGQVGRVQRIVAMESAPSGPRPASPAPGGPRHPRGRSFSERRFSGGARSGRPDGPRRQDGRRNGPGGTSGRRFGPPRGPRREDGGQGGGFSRPPRPERNSPIKRYPCPCCDYLTIDRPTPGSYEVCAVCYWEDNPEQAANPDSTIGGNGVSLNEGRQNFLTFGACEHRYANAVRKPRPEDVPNH